MADRMTVTEGLDWIMDSPFGKAKRLFFNVMAHDMADNMFLQRKAQAKAMGLDEDDPERFPTAGNSSMILKQTTGLIPWLTAAALGAAGLWGAGMLLDQTPAVETPAAVDTDTDTVLQLDFYKPE
jgi:hypothetical protein